MCSGGEVEWKEKEQREKRRKEIERKRKSEVGGLKTDHRRGEKRR